MAKSAQLAYASEVINYGYSEIKEHECPVQWNCRDILYFKKDNRYTMVDKDGVFISWKHPEETNKVKKVYYIKDLK